MNPGFQHRRATDCAVFRIAAGDTNKMAVIADRAHGAPFTAVIEIFEPGGRTPPNRHEIAHELFYVISGTGRATCNGTSVEVGPGDSLLLAPGNDHALENIGPDKLVCFTVMVPDEGFSALIRGGIPMALDAADLEAIGASASPAPAATAGSATPPPAG